MPLLKSPVDKERQTFTFLRNLFSTAFASNDPDPIGIPPNESEVLDPFAGVGGLSQSYGVDINNIDPNDLPSREMSNPFEDRSQFTRRQRYQEYDLLEEMISEVHSALDTYANESASQDEDGRVLKVNCGNQRVKEEVENLFFNLLNINDNSWGWLRNLCKYGDLFLEHIIDFKNPQLGILGVQELDPATMWRVETQRGRLLEFQQAVNGPDYTAVIQDLKDRWSGKDRNEQSTRIKWMRRSQLSQKKSIRFAPAQVSHIKIGPKRRGFYPYGVSILAAARRPAHHLRLMEDAMLVYRLTRAPERRVYYVDVGMLQGQQVKNYLQSFKSEIKRKKIYNERTQSIDESWSPMAVDDDLFLPTRASGGSRVDTLPGAQNLGEIDDALYFRKKLYVALKIPPGYLDQTVEAQTNRLTLSSLDIRFAKTIMRMQKAIERSLRELAVVHLALKNVPRSMYEDLEIIMTPSSDWQEIAKAEVIDARITRAGNLKSSDLFTDEYIMEEVLRMSKDEAQEQVRLKQEQDLEKARLEAQKAIIQGRAQAVIDYGNQINQVRASAKVAELQQNPAGMPGPEGGSPGDMAGAPSAPEETGPPENTPVPSEEEIASGLPQPGDAEGENQPEEIPDEKKVFTPADWEVERDLNNF